jgi:hypothetical protein
MHDKAFFFPSKNTFIGTVMLSFGLHIEKNGVDVWLLTLSLSVHTAICLPVCIAAKREL